MESAVELEVPNRVDYESGKNWGNIKQEETMDTLEHFWTEHKKAVIIVAVVIVVLIIL